MTPTLHLYSDKKNRQFILCSYAPDPEFGGLIFSGQYDAISSDAFIKSSKEIILQDFDGFERRRPGSPESYSVSKKFKKLPLISISIPARGADNSIVFNKMRKSRGGGHEGFPEDRLELPMSATTEEYSKAILDLFEI